MFSRARGTNLLASVPAARQPRSAAFTLLEVLIGVMVIGLLTLGVYKFVRTNLLAVQLSTQLTKEQQEMDGLINFIRVQLNDLPAKGVGVLSGSAAKWRDMPTDKMEWMCTAGHGLLTTAARGEYFGTLTIAPVPDKTSPDWHIVLRRRPTENQESNYDELELMRPAVSLEIHYWNPNTGGELERWNDQNMRPSMVRIKIKRTANSEPIEVVLPVPAGTMQPQ